MIALLFARAHRAGLACLFTLLGIIAAGPAFGSSIDIELLGSDPEVRCISLRIVMENTEAETVQWKTRIECDPNSYELGVISLRAGERRTLFLGLPMLRETGLSVTAVDRRTGDQVFDSAYGQQPKLFLHLAEPSNWLSPTELLRFTTATLQPTEVPDPSALPGMPASGAMMPGGGMMPPGGPVPDPTYHFSGFTSTRSTLDMVSQIAPSAGLPDTWQCFTPFRAVLLREDVFNALPEGTRRALEDYAAEGGNVVVYASSQPREVPRLRGRIEFVAGDPLRNPGLRVDWQASPLRWQTLRDVEFPVLDAKDGPPRGGLFIAALFFIVAGPLNYFYFVRRGRIRRLLISVPLISGACCLLILIWFVLSQGFTRTGGTLALTLLDESTDQALTYGLHHLESGLYPRGGFGFARETALRPRPRRVDYGYGHDYRAQAYTMQIGAEQRIVSGMFLPRIPLAYNTLLPWRTRERLVINEQARTVTNGFEQPIIEGVIALGQTPTTDSFGDPVVPVVPMLRFGPLAPGETGPLQPMPPDQISQGPPLPAMLKLTNEQREVMDRLLDQQSAGAIRRGIPYYVLRMKGRTPTMQAGVEFGARATTEHVLVGIQHARPRAAQ